MTPQVLIIQKTNETVYILVYIETVIFGCTELDGKLDHIQAMCLQRGWQVLFESFRANHTKLHLNSHYRPTLKSPDLMRLSGKEIGKTN